MDLIEIPAYISITGLWIKKVSFSVSLFSHECMTTIAVLPLHTHLRP